MDEFVADKSQFQNYLFSLNLLADLPMWLKSLMHDSCYQHLAHRLDKSSGSQHVQFPKCNLLTA